MTPHSHAGSVGGVRLSLNVTDFSWPGGPGRPAAELGRLARQADEGGLDTLWVADHLLQGAPGADPSEAALTSRIRLGAMVSAVPLRPPALLVKAVTTLDVLSGGRAWLGVGAGGPSGGAGPFAGARHRESRPVAGPAPLTRPHPPILVGGAGETRTLRLVARYAQACNVFDVPDGGATIRRKLEVLARHCAAEGTSLRGDLQDRQHPAGTGRERRGVHRAGAGAGRAGRRPSHRDHFGAVDGRAAGAVARGP